MQPRHSRQDVKHEAEGEHGQPHGVVGLGAAQQFLEVGHVDFDYVPLKQHVCATHAHVHALLHAQRLVQHPGGMHGSIGALSHDFLLFHDRALQVDVDVSIDLLGLLFATFVVVAPRG